MKKRDLERTIHGLARKRGTTFVRVGGTRHDKYLLNGRVIMIPRHNEIGEMLAKEILKQCEKALKSR